jgi:hypothetical protein
MKNYNKVYLGKGTKISNLDIISFSIDLDAAEKFAFEYNGRKFLKLEIAKLQQADNFQRTHTVYASVKEGAEETRESKEETAKRTKRTRKAAASTVNEPVLPF